ncbi:MAG: preprotein translocase subunit SecE [Candidatus Melainabacteria bacterium LEY3_CP_29_8]|nr:MAG: preprotein translocase subunit SecE [Candidatus Melainabacteria bacterium LEY3_CP_29_8]
MGNIAKFEKKNDNFVSQMKSYFKGVKIEWGKITWPEKKQVFVETLYVIVIVFVFTLFILILDLIYKGAFSFLKIN